MKKVINKKASFGIIKNNIQPKLVNKKSTKKIQKIEPETENVVTTEVE